MKVASEEDPVDILNRVEARWFIDDVHGNDAVAAMAWFSEVTPEGQREDRYLLTGREEIGFKARVEQGKPAKVETKYLVSSLGPTPLQERIFGLVERWTKLSLDLVDPDLEKDGQWIRVAKARSLR